MFKTRTLMLWSVICGLAIMAAGAVFLFRLANQDALDEPIEIGVPAAVGDMTVTLLAADEAGGELAVEVRLAGAADDAPGDEFRLIASGRGLTVDTTTCPALRAGAAGVECTLRFDTSLADGVSRVLFYDRGDASARWVLG